MYQKNMYMYRLKLEVSDTCISYDTTIVPWHNILANHPHNGSYKWGGENPGMVSQDEVQEVFTYAQITSYVS